MAINKEPLLKKCKYLGISPMVMGVSKDTKRKADQGNRKKLSEYGMQLKEKQKLKRIIISQKVNTIAIGNGTASRESEAVVAEIVKETDQKVSYMVVSEAGASVYSASKLAAEEFPDYDVSLRSAVSIARRLQDPLAELVKIEPKAIGVGQYQHDMPKARLNEALGGVAQ